MQKLLKINSWKIEENKKFVSETNNPQYTWKLSKLKWEPVLWINLRRIQREKIEKNWAPRGRIVVFLLQKADPKIQKQQESQELTTHTSILSSILFIFNNMVFSDNLVWTISDSFEFRIKYLNTERLSGWILKGLATVKKFSLLYSVSSPHLYLNAIAVSVGSWDVASISILEEILKLWK